MTDEELRAYYDRTSSFEEGLPVRTANVTFKLKPRRLVALRLESETLDGLRRIAVKKGLNYSTLMRMWITERLRQEESSRRGL